MSFIQSTLKCIKCGHEMNVAFGIVGSTQIAGHPTKCSECGSSKLERISEGWNAKEPKTPKETIDDKIRSLIYSLECYKNSSDHYSEQEVLEDIETIKNFIS